MRRGALSAKLGAVTTQQRIQEKLSAALAPLHLDVENESRKHNVPAGSETHFKVLVVAGAFEGLGLVDRHRRVNEILAEELRGGVHALSIRALAPSQWAPAQAESFQSPPCLGGSKA
jgi:stress-induced morphogen